MIEAPPFLSVVVPTRNRAGLLRDCVASLRQQNYPANRFEIIVVDDGSTDETPAVVIDIKALAKTPDLRYVRPKGRGLPCARNAGLHAACGDPIVFADDDVIAPPNWLKAIGEGCVRHPQAGCVGGPIRLRLEGTPPRLCQRDRLGESELDLGSQERPVKSVFGANMALRRAAIEEVGWFNESLATAGDEEEWQWRLSRTGRDIIYLPDAWLWHRRTAVDLRLSRLVRRRFRRGREQIVFERAVGGHVRLSEELAAIPRLLGHAVRHACVGGVLAASARAGRACGILREYTEVKRLLKHLLRLKVGEERGNLR